MLKVTRLSGGSLLPAKSFPGDLGYDLYSAESVVLENGISLAVSTGVAVEFPSGWGAVIKDRSSMAIKGIYTSGGVIDHGYRGEIKILIRNDSGKEFVVKTGDRVAQLVPVPVTSWRIEEVTQEALTESARKERGFGSSGR